LRVKKLHAAILAGGLEPSGQRNAGDPTFGPHPPMTNPPAAGGAGGLFTQTPAGTDNYTFPALFSVPNLRDGN